ncbi:MAG TPA: hypothetical protein VEH05_18830 [Streptosporangiaceae bacterium]|nr:hypothetical protein [Streptosporangiaceae bacterium]
MTTEQGPPEPQEHRWPRWWPFDGFGGLLTRTQAYVPTVPAGGPPADRPVARDDGERGNGPAEPAGNGANGPVIQGEVVSEEERAARELAQQKERAAAEHLPLSPYYQEQLRLQLADHAEREHQLRLVSKGYENVPEPLGPGGGITAEVVQAMAEAIAEKQLPAPDGSPEHRELLLFGALAAAGLNQEAARVSFVISRGRLMLDVSTADHDGTEPSTRLVRLPGRPERAEQDAGERADQDAGERAEQDAGERADQDAAERADQDAAQRADQGTKELAEQDTAQHDPTGPPEDGEPPARYAAVICGSAAAIAGGRPFLGMDALTTYARRAAFRAGGLADPHAARRSMRAAHRIEVVVLLDVSLGGGVWVDVDPKTGRPAATLSIDLKQAGFQFTPLAAA